MPIHPISLLEGRTTIQTTGFHRTGLSNPVTRAFDFYCLMLKMPSWWDCNFGIRLVTADMGPWCKLRHLAGKMLRAERQLSHQ